jgi:hypothetical protein
MSNLLEWGSSGFIWTFWGESVLWLKAQSILLSLALKTTRRSKTWLRFLVYCCAFHGPTLARSNSVSALSWAKKDSVCSDLAVRASMLQRCTLSPTTPSLWARYILVTRITPALTSYRGQAGSTWDKLLIYDR